MKALKIRYANLPEVLAPERVHKYLDTVAIVPIACFPWEVYPDTVKVNYSVAHNGSALLLKFRVEEEYLTAASVTNGAVHKDSCVEFFVAFGDDDCYYNLEFNCIGWAKIGYGRDRRHRSLLPDDKINEVLSFSTIISGETEGEKRFSWEISLVIPASVFFYNNIVSFMSLKARGNFYKCKGTPPSDHYISWNMVKAPKPDFHRKECFGELEFE